MKKMILTALSTVALSAFLWALPSSQTGTVNVSWTPRFDTDYPSTAYFTGFNIYYGTTTNIASDTMAQSGPTTTNLVIGGLTRGATYYFTATEVGTNGLESDPVPFIAYKVPNKPGAPSPATVIQQ